MCKREQTVKKEDEFAEYDVWGLQLKVPPVPEDNKEIKAIWRSAFNILDGSTQKTGQTVALDLENDGYYGREHIKVLLSLQNNSFVGTLVGLGSVSLQIFPRPALLSCLPIDAYVGALYSYISGNNVSHTVNLCSRFIIRMAEHASVFDDFFHIVEINLILVQRALREVLCREARAR